MERRYVVIVYSHALFCEGLTSILRQQPSIELLGMLAEGEDILDKVKTLKPDVIIVDANLEGEDAGEAVHKYWKDHPSLKVIFLNLNGNGMMIFSKTVLQNACGQDLLNAIGVGSDTSARPSDPCSVLHSNKR